MNKVNVSLNQLKTLLNYTSDGNFATSAASTRGTLQLDSNGKIQNAGRHFFSSSAPSSPEQNFRMRQAIVEVFSSNKATEEFMSDLRDRLGLDKDGLSSGRTDKKGTTISNKPLERREVKEIITAFERTRDKSFLGNYEVLELPNGNEPGRDVENHPVDPYTRRIGELSKAGETFMKELEAGFKACGFLPGEGESTPGQKIAQLQFQLIKDRMAGLSQEVESGMRSVNDALASLAGFIDATIGIGSSHSEEVPRETMTARMTTVYKALDTFAKALGATGDHPFRDVMLSNFKADVKQAVINSNFSGKAPIETQKKSLVDFANSIMRKAIDTQRLINHDPRLPEKDQMNVHFLLHPDMANQDTTVFSELENIVENDLTRLMKHWEDDENGIVFEMISDLCNELNDKKGEDRADYDQAQLDLSNANAGKDAKTMYVTKIKADRVNEEYFLRTGAYDVIWAMGFSI